MTKIKITDLKDLPLQDSTLKPMQSKVNAEYRPEVPIEKKITANDHDILIYNIKDVDKRNNDTNDNLNAAQAQVKLVNEAINTLYDNVKWTKIYGEASPVSRLDKMILNAAGAYPQYLDGWYITQEAYNSLTSDEYKYWLWIWYDSENNLNYATASSYLNKMVDYTLNSAGTSRGSHLSWNQNTYIKTTESHSVGPNLDHLASSWAEDSSNTNPQKDILLARIDETDLNTIDASAKVELYVFLPFFHTSFNDVKPTWRLEGIYGRKEDAIPLNNDSKFLWKLLGSQLEFNPNSPYQKTWNTANEPEDEDITRMNSDGSSGVDFEMLLTLGNNTTPWISFNNEASNDKYYVRISNQFHGANYIDIITSKPNWNYSNKPSIFFREMFLEDLNYNLGLDSNENFINEYETLLFSLFANLSIETPIFNNPQYMDYSPTITISPLNK